MTNLIKLETKDDNKRFSLVASERKVLAVLAFYLHLFIVLMAFLVLCFSVYVKVYMEQELNLIEGFKPHALSDFLMVLSCFMLILHTLACSLLRRYKFTKTFRQYQMLLLICLGFLFAFGWLILVGAVLCFVQGEKIEVVFQQGILDSMKQYKENLDAKMTIDVLQIDYHCCGSSSPTDWFQINWINERYLNVYSMQVKSKLIKGYYFSDDVPSSCCDVNAHLPCIHHNVKHHLKYADEGEVTLYLNGCTGPLVDFFENGFLLPVGCILMISFFIEMTIVVLTRLFQTSLNNAFCRGDIDGVGSAHLLPSLVKKKL